MFKPDLVVTRHPALVDYLREQGLVDQQVEVLAHITDPTALQGRLVVGVLPLHLAAEAVEVWEVPLAVPAELRGVELTLQQVRQYAAPVRRYRVHALGEPVA